MEYMYISPKQSSDVLKGTGFNLVSGEELVFGIILEVVGFCVSFHSCRDISGEYVLCSLDPTSL